MDQIPNWYWMIIIAGLSGMLGLIFYYMAMLLKEAMLTVREARFMMVEMHDIIDAFKLIIEKSQRIVDIVATTVENVSETIMKPLAKITAVFATVKKFTSGFSSLRGEAAQED